MFPESMHDFLLATIGAAASFIGLLFVALSFVLNDTKQPKSQIIARRIRAESSYSALINIFFITLVALLPDTTVGYVALTMALIGLFSTRLLLRNGRRLTENLPSLGLSVFTYVLEGAFAVNVLRHGDKYQPDKRWFLTIIILLFIVALTRAWELTGIHSKLDD